VKLRNQKITKYILAIVVSNLLALSMLFAVPHSAQASVTNINICANKATGAQRSIHKGICLTSEFTIGIGPLTPGNIRPKQMNAILTNRIKLAQVVAKKSGHTLNITSGWRALEYQQKLFDNAVIKNGSEAEASKWVLPPEFSMHPWGLAVDINYGAGKKEGAVWLEANGYRFGLCRRYENEWWHFEPLVAPGTQCPALEEYPVAK
jgi:hypothetical protein